MKTKTYQCENSSACVLAQSKELITIDDSGNFSCESGRYYACPCKSPNCQQDHLREIAKKKSSINFVLLGGIAAGLLVVAVIGSMMLGGGGSNPQKIAAELQKIWPWLAP